MSEQTRERSLNELARGLASGNLSQRNVLCATAGYREVYERLQQWGPFVFDEFTFTLDGLRQLAAWFSERLDGTLHPSGAEAQIDLAGHNRIEHLTKALRHLAGERDS